MKELPLRGERRPRCLHHPKEDQFPPACTCDRSRSVPKLASQSRRSKVYVSDLAWRAEWGEVTIVAISFRTPSNFLEALLVAFLAASSSFVLSASSSTTCSVPSLSAAISSSILRIRASTAVLLAWSFLTAAFSDLIVLPRLSRRACVVVSCSSLKVVLQAVA